LRQHRTRKFGEITQNKGPYTVQGRSFKVTDFGTNRKLMYDFLLVINTNLLHILHRFRDIQLSIRPKSLYLATPLAFNPPDGGLPYVISL